jgi:calcineurin-like phosphoesterase family protein
MHNTFLIADPHLCHQGMVTFKRGDGSPLRPFSSIEEHDETIIERWNKVVKPHDRVQVMGDVIMKRRFLPILKRLNGRLRLIAGNHDIFKLKDYLTYFDDIKAFHVMDRFALTHIPIHVSCLGRFKGNVHGHIHQHRVKRKKFFGLVTEIDPRYFCVSAEHIDYTPMSWDEVRKRFYKQLGLTISND